MRKQNTVHDISSTNTTVGEGGASSSRACQPVEIKKFTKRPGILGRSQAGDVSWSKFMGFLLGWGIPSHLGPDTEISVMDLHLYSAKRLGDPPTC